MTFPLKLKQASISQEEKITKALYKDYSLFKRALFADLIANHSDIDQLTLFNKTQKLLDRLLFIFFAEDSRLLPANTAHNIIKEYEKAKELNIPITIYSHLKNYFNYLNTGYKTDSIEIFAYNGGLFKPDDVLDRLVISDDVLYTHIKKIADYDFDSEIDVNILGHIFENSLNEIDEIKASLNGETLDKTNTKRKKDGVFYTPKYITSYIVQNTVGKLCNDKKQALGIIDSDYYQEVHYTKTGKRKKLDKDDMQKQKTLYDNLIAYRNWLLSITICDPACGSGAFLNEALNFLIGEHRYIDELESKLTGSSLTYQNVANHILENNLFGVDINEESVQIAKLSLWLRTAEPHRKLSNLNENIKCGNSLIADKNIAGDKAFDWQKEFPKVFDPLKNQGGGFDVVIGNPPYGAILSKLQKTFIQENYKSFEYQVNTYVIFYELGLNILQNNGILGYITPATFTYGHYFKNIREIFSNYNQLFISKYFYDVFADADIGDTVTWIIQKSENNKSDIFIQLCYNAEDATQKPSLSGYLEIINNDFTYNLNKSSFNFNKFSDNCLELGSISNIIVGIKPYQTGKGKPAQTAQIVKDKIFTTFDIKPNDSYTQCIIGKDFHRYKFLNEPNMFIQYGDWLAEPRFTAPFFDNEKIIIRQTADSLICHIDNLKRVNLNNVYNVGKTNDNFNLKYLLCILNSKFMNAIYQNISQEKGKLFAEVKKVYLEKLPIKDISLSEQQPFIEKADLMLKLNQQFQAKSDKMLRTLTREFDLTEFSKSLQNWHLLSFKDFVKELEKKKVKLSLAQKSEWEEFFMDAQKEILSIQTDIDNTDTLINQLVYELYGLSDDEILIVERG